MSLSFAEFCPDAATESRIVSTFRSRAMQRAAAEADGGTVIPIPEGLRALLENPSARAIFDHPEDALADDQILGVALANGCVASRACSAVLTWSTRTVRRTGILRFAVWTCCSKQNHPWKPRRREAAPP